MLAPGQSVQSDFFTAFSLPARSIPGMSEKRRVPPNTRAVPSQWYTVNGFLKYRMEKRRLINLRSVMTRVTVRLAHSVVSTNTEEMLKGFQWKILLKTFLDYRVEIYQMYWVITLPSR